MKEKILVSSCLLGESCRWHGKKLKASPFLKKYLKEAEEDNRKIEFISVCPETLGGLKTPRNPVKRRKDRVWETCPEKSLRKHVTGNEVTKEFRKGARKVLKIAEKYKIKKAILCKWSPYCDIRGITGKLLDEKGIEIINTY